MPFGVAALRSHAACCFLMHSCLAESVGMMVGVTLLCTLGTDGCESMERVILFFVISVGCGHTWKRLHPRNSWHVGVNIGLVEKPFQHTCLYHLQDCVVNGDYLAI